MPRGDRTGPNGMGPMTGRAVGYCSGNPVPGFANSWYGRGGWFGRGLGLGRSRGGSYGYRAVYPPYAPPANTGYYPPAPMPTPEANLSLLRAQAEQLNTMLADIQKQIEELESHKED